MSSSRRLLIVKSAFFVLLLMLLQTSQVSALGGLFSKQQKPFSLSNNTNTSNNTANNHDAVQLTKSSVILGVHQDENTVTLQIQIEYQQQESLHDNSNNNDNNNELAWIIPLPAAPTKVQMGSGGLLFYALENQTQPSFILDLNNVSKKEEVPVMDSAVTATARASTFNTWNNDFANTNYSIGYCQAEDLLGVCSRSSSDVEGNETIIPIKNGNETMNNIEEEFYLIPDNDNNENDDSSITMTSAGIFDYAIIPNDDGAEQVINWLLENNYSLPEPRRDNGTIMSSLEDVLLDYEARGNVFMVVQLRQHGDASDIPKNKNGFSHPLMIQYPLPLSSSSSSWVAHSLPLQLTSWTASPTANIHTYFLSDQAEERAVPINYLDVELDNSFADWLGCHYYDKDKADACYQKNYHDRFGRAVQEMLPQQQQLPTWMTEYAGPIDQDSLHDLLSIPQGFTIVLAAQTTWLRFFTSLLNRGVPATPMVLELLDQYVPPPSLGMRSKSKQGLALNGDNIDALEECQTLEHMYMPGRYDLMNACFNAYVPPSDDWTFDSSGLASDLDKLIFGPCRKARDWMRPFQYLTRMYGDLSPTSASSLTEEGEGEDPYFVFSSNAGSLSRVENSFSALAVPICDKDGPFSLEMTLSKNDDDSTSTFWQPAQLSCDSNTWIKTMDGPVYYSESHSQNGTKIMTVPIKKTTATALQACQIARHRYGRTIHRNETTGQFNPEDIVEARQNCREFLESIIGTGDDGMVIDGGASSDQDSPSSNSPNGNGGSNSNGNQPTPPGTSYDPPTGDSDGIPSDVDSSDILSGSSCDAALQIPKLAVCFFLLGAWLIL